MTLSAGLEVARSGLSVTSDQTAIVSRNVCERRQSAGLAQDRERHHLAVGRSGARIDHARDQPGALREPAVGDIGLERAPGARCRARPARSDHQRSRARCLAGGAGRQARRCAAAVRLRSSRRLSRAQSAVAAASRLVQSLNGATQLVQDVRAQADADIANSVARLNELLSQFETINNEIIKGTRSGADITDYLDARDRTLASISEEVGVRTITRADNDMVVFTDSGVTLFETRRADRQLHSARRSIPLGRPETRSTSTACRSPAAAAWPSSPAG